MEPQTSQNLLHVIFQESIGVKGVTVAHGALGSEQGTAYIVTHLNPTINNVQFAVFLDGLMKHSRLLRNALLLCGIILDGAVF